MKRAIIIGSGLGGLSAASLLSRLDFEVTVLEQNSVAGGCLQCFTRGGVRFETGMHYIGSALPGQPLDELLHVYELNGKLPLAPLDSNGYDIIRIGNNEFPFALGRDSFVSSLAEFFPSQRENLHRYCDAIDDVARASSLRNIFSPRNDTALLTAKYHTSSIDTIIDELFTDELLKKVVIGNLPLYAGRKGVTPFAQHAFIHDFYNRSAFRIAGGSDAIARELIANIELRGGKVFTSARVTRIFTDSTHATGVEINGSDFMPADIIVSTIHPAPLMQLLSDCSLLRPAFRRRMADLPLTSSVFSLYLKFRKGAVSYRNNNLYAYRSDPWGCEQLDSDGRNHGYLYMHFCDSPGNTTARGGVIISYMDYNRVAPWKGTSVMRRGEDYRRLMTETAERLLDRVEEDFPGFRNDIDCYYTASPLTYEDYTSTPQGAMYGVAKDISLGVGGRVPHLTRIPNLFIGGQNINSHGLLGVMLGTTIMVSDIVGRDRLSTIINPFL